MHYYDIYYQKDFDPHYKIDFDGTVKISKADIQDPKHYGFVARVAITPRTEKNLELENVFHDMQGEIWSPLGEARNLIKALGLRHTSMSMGDVAHDVINDRWFMVAMAGFTEM